MSWEDGSDSRLAWYRDEGGPYRLAGPRRPLCSPGWPHEEAHGAVNEEEETDERDL